jgi:hypothetical protein
MQVDEWRIDEGLSFLLSQVITEIAVDFDMKRPMTMPTLGFNRERERLSA